MIRGLIPGTRKRVSVPENSQTSFGAHPTSLSKGIGNNFKDIMETRA
jgi:hypothetical protein